MELFVNGESKACSESTSLAHFIQQLGMKGDRVAVELNREIVPRTQWDSIQLHEGDRLEIVHFVGGGSASPLATPRNSFAMYNIFAASAVPCKIRATPTPRLVDMNANAK